MFIHRILQDLGLRYASGAFKNLRLLEKTEWWHPAEIRQLQFERFRKLLAHAANRVPYYRQVFADHGFRLDDIGPDNLCELPLLDRQIVREEYDRLRSLDLKSRRWKESSSGGSTGEPVRFVVDQEFTDWSRALKRFFDTWSGHEPGARKVLLWGSERDLFIGRESARIRMLRWIKNEIWFNSFRMTPDSMRGYLAALEEFRPMQITAYANSMYELALFAQREGIRPYRPKSILTSAGTLFPEMRKTIETVFGCPVFNRYGSREMGDIACECDRHAGLHVSALTHIVEIIRPDGSLAEPGELGEVVVTHLGNFSMPLIRYRIGDIAAWATEPCTCGRGLPLLKSVSGRVMDVLIRRDGGVVTPEYMVHLIGVVVNRGQIDKFQVIQESVDRVRVLIVPNPMAVGLNQVCAEIMDKVQLVMGEWCEVEVSVEEDIPPSSSGKHRYTISHVNRWAESGSPSVRSHSTT